MNLHDLVAEAAARTPDAIAVDGPCGRATYRELDERANVLAATLHARGVRRGNRVLLWGAKSVELLAAMQAVLRLGAAHVPVDPVTPGERGGPLARPSGARALCAPAALPAPIPAPPQRPPLRGPGPGPRGPPPPAGAG